MPVAGTPTNDLWGLHAKLCTVVWPEEHRLNCLVWLVELPLDPDPDPDPTRFPLYFPVFRNWTEQAKRLIIMLLGEIQQACVKAHLGWSTVAMVKLLKSLNGNNFFVNFLYLMKDEQLNMIHSLGYWAKRSSLTDMCTKSGFVDQSDELIKYFWFFFFFNVSTEYFSLLSEIKHYPPP